MAVRIFPYYRGSDLSALIRHLLSGDDQISSEVRFLGPSRKDRDWWLRRAGQDQYGPTGQRGGPWTWQELYDDLCASLGTRRRRPLSPPDHLLILRRILDGVLDENALSSVGFGKEKVDEILKRNGLDRKDVFLLALCPDGRYTLQKKERGK